VIFDFSNGRRSPSCACLDHPQKVLGDLYQFAQNCWNRCSNFDNMQVVIFCELGLKMSVHAPRPKKVFFGFDP